MRSIAISDPDRDGPVASPIHQALVRPLQYLGVERQVIALETTLGAALLFGAHPSVLSIGVLALVLAVMHPTFVWLTAREPMVTELYLRNVTYADFYAPTPAMPDRPRTPRPSVPRLG